MSRVSHRLDLSSKLAKIRWFYFLLDPAPLIFQGNDFQGKNWRQFVLRPGANLTSEPRLPSTKVRFELCLNNLVGNKNSHQLSSNETQEEKEKKNGLRDRNKARANLRNPTHGFAAETQFRVSRENTSSLT